VKILLTGATGFVGAALLPMLRGAGHQVTPVGFRQAGGDRVVADLTDGATVADLLAREAPEAIVHLAGNKDVFFCEQNEAASRRLNVEMTEHLVRACRGRPTRLLYLSSDYVFDGIGVPFDESSERCPTTRYGAHKCEAEDLIDSASEDHAILRSSGLYGAGSDFVSVVLRVLGGGETFRAFDNLHNNPTFLGDLGKMVDAVLDRGLSGVFHCVGGQTVSRYQFARSIAEVAGLDVRHVVPEALDFSIDIRPPRLEMDGRRTYAIVGIVPETIRDILARDARVLAARGSEAQG